MKIIINKSHGSFEFSEAAILLGLARGGDTTSRVCPVMAQIVEELGDEASGRFSELKIVDVPDDVNWVVKDYDGCEWIAETHRTWR